MQDSRVWRAIVDREHHSNYSKYKQYSNMCVMEVDPFLKAISENRFESFIIFTAAKYYLLYNLYVFNKEAIATPETHYATTLIEKGKIAITIEIHQEERFVIGNLKMFNEAH